MSGKANELHLPNNVKWQTCLPLERKAKLMTSQTTAKKTTAKVTPLTVDMSKRIDEMNAAELKAYNKRVTEIAKEKAAAEKQLRAMQKEAEKLDKEQDELPQEPLVIIPGSGTLPLPIAALMPLDNGLFPDGEYATRKIDQDHVAGMVTTLQNGEYLPPISTVLTNYGSFILDGLHRYTAHIEYMKILMHVQGGLSTLDEDKQTDTDRQNIVDAMQRYTVDVEELDFETPGDAINYAFQANAKHGLKQSQQSKAQYGLWLYKWMKEKGTPMSLRAIASKLGIKHQTLTVTRDRLLKLKKTPKMVDAMLSQDDEQFLEEGKVEREKADRTVDTDDKFIEALIKAARHFEGAGWIENGKVDRTGVEYLRPKLALVSQDALRALYAVTVAMVHIGNERTLSGTPKQNELPIVGFSQVHTPVESTM